MTTKNQRAKLIELKSRAFQGPFEAYATLIYSEKEKASICEMSEPFANETLRHTPLGIGSKEFKRVNATRDYLALAGTCAADLAREVEDMLGLLGTSLKIVDNLVGLVAVESDLDAEDFHKILADVEKVKTYLSLRGDSDPKEGVK